MFKKASQLGPNKLKLDLKLLPKIFFRCISTEESTSKIDADLAQNEM